MISSKKGFVDSKLGSKDKVVNTNDTIQTENWNKVRAEWLGNETQKSKAKANAKSKPVADSYRGDIYEIIKSVRPPYPAFKHNISLENMIDLLLEVWEDDED